MEEAGATTASSNWNVVSGTLESVVDLVLGDGLGTSHPTSAVVLERAIESGYCEITAGFQKNLCTVRSICILSDARQCEVYYLGEPGGDGEYFATARGYEVEEGVSGGPFYEAEVELVNSEPWAGIKIRLLSLVNKSRVSVRKLSIMAELGPAIARAEENRGRDDGNLMKMVMPSVLQMLRGMPERKRETGTVPKGGDEVAQIQVAAAAAEMGVEREEDKSFQREMTCRLQGLEVAVGSIESFLREAFGKLDDRMGRLENQVSELRMQTSSALDVSARLGNLENQVSERRVQTSAGEDDVSARIEKLEFQVSELLLPPSAAEVSPTFSKADDVGDGIAEPLNAEVSEDVEVSARGSSSSLEHAWSSSLAAFSVSAALDSVDEASNDQPADDHDLNNTLEEEHDHCEAQLSYTEDITADTVLMETEITEIQTGKTQEALVITGSDEATAAAAAGTNYFDLIEWSTGEDMVYTSSAAAAAAADQPSNSSQVFSLIDCIDMPSEASDVAGIPRDNGCEQVETPVSDSLIEP